MRYSPREVADAELNKDLDLLLSSSHFSSYPSSSIIFTYFILIYLLFCPCCGVFKDKNPSLSILLF